MKKEIDYIEFYITNVCNLGCNNCNRLNNFHFKGSQDWSDYHHLYKKWSERVDIKKIVILGGEPTLNPSLREWCLGIRSLWPDASLILLTNGSRLSKLPWLYEVCKEYNMEIEITAHGKNRYAMLYKDIKEFLTGPIVEKYDKNYSDWVDAYKNVKDASWPECKSIKHFPNLPEEIKTECKEIHRIDPEYFLSEKNRLHLHLKDQNGVIVTLSFAESFVSAPLKFDGNKSVSVYNSDREAAHNVCISKYSHHFIDGKMYKCHHVALLPKFMEQFHVEISKEDEELLRRYKPATVDFTDAELAKFLGDLKCSIEQCKLCPENLDSFFLDGTDKKPKLDKKIPIVKLRST